jgi:hypothetical protein
MAQAGLRDRRREVFFSEEKKQKTFAHWRWCQPGHVRQVAKVFWSFFSKKNMLYSSTQVSFDPPP